MAVDDPVVDAEFEVVDDINIKSVLSNGMHKATCSDPLLPGLGDVFGLSEEGAKRRQLNRMLYFRANPEKYAYMMLPESEKLELARIAAEESAAILAAEVKAYKLAHPEELF